MNNLYKEGIDRKTLHLPLLDDYIGENNIARAIDIFVESLDVIKLNFTNSNLTVKDGQPAYHPKLLLKIYIYGYLHKIRTSRTIQREIAKNVELIWLTQGLTPKFKTIANFRKDNSEPLQQVFKDFVQLLKNLDIEDEAKKKIEELNDKKKLLSKDLELLEEKNKNQYNKTDPDASIMVKPAHNVVAYNTKIAVDSKHKFIIETYVSTNGNDKQELHKMGSKVQEVLDKKEINLGGDTGYHSAKEIKKCIDDGITPYVHGPKPKNPEEEKGKFTKSQFRYDKESDSYICPNEKSVKKITSRE